MYYIVTFKGGAKERIWVTNWQGFSERIINGIDSNPLSKQFNYWDDNLYLNFSEVVAIVEDESVGK